MLRYAVTPVLSDARRAFLSLAALTVSLIAACTALADADNYAKTLKSTAWIITSNADNETSTGTGVYIDAEKRLVLTNSQVVGDSRSAVVFFPDMRGEGPVFKRKHYLDGVLKLAYRGKVVAIDRGRDLALIELTKTPSATPIALAEKSISPGSDVDVIGNPGGSDVLWVYTSGTVRSVYAKRFKSDHGSHDFKVVEIQSPIRQGDSGGPIVNAAGELVAIAQSFSPKNPLVSFGVDLNEIKSFIDSSWKPAPRPTKELLEDAAIAHRKHSTGHYEVEHELSGGKTQSVFIAKTTEYFQRADVRKVWSLVSVDKEAPSAAVMIRLLRQSSVTKIGSWAVEKNSAGEHMVLFVAKLDATAPDEALEATIEYVARIANAMSEELAPQQQTTAAQTLASWLAE